MKQKRFISIFILITLFFLLLCPIRSEAATTSQQKAVKSQVTKYLKGIKNSDFTAIKKVMNANAKKKLVSFDSNIEKVLKKMRKRWFSYQIKDVKVSGKTATVRVRVKYYDTYDRYIGALEDTLKEVRKKYLKSGGEYDPSSTELSKIWAKYLLKDYKQYMTFAEPSYDDEFITKNITITLVKEKGKWKISKNTKAMQYMTNCGASEAHDYIMSHSDKFERIFILGF